MMTSRERLLAVLHGEIPDCVPCDPDISNMVPARLTGRPFTDIYLHQDPPLWKAHIDALKYFDIDGGFEIYGLPLGLEDAAAPDDRWEERVVDRRDDGSVVTQWYSYKSDQYSPYATVYTKDNPPIANVFPHTVGLPERPSAWEPITEVRQWPTGMELWRLVREEMGNQGVVGVNAGTTLVLGTVNDVYSYYEDPEPWRARSRAMVAEVERRMERIAAMDPRPDFIMCGGSGSLVFQTPGIFRELALPVLKRVTEMAYDLGIPTHVHSCGPETKLVEIAATETKLTIIDPLEVPPMGDCNLADLKKRFGGHIVLKGNLHTTDVMLRGTVADVVAASKKAIDDAGAGGGFILSTGDQCGRDTPDANLFAMVETARTYGKY